MSTPPMPLLHSRFSYHVDYVGREQQPVLVIDNFVESADLLVDWAEQHGVFQVADAYYPGIRAKTPALYSRLLCTRLQVLICQVFGFDENKSIGADCKFSIVTTKPEHLASGQSIPHYDSLNSYELAAVHYLCLPEMGGTSLYSHEATGFETISDERIAAYRKTIASEFNKIPKEYINGSTPLYKCIASYEAVFNRLIIYRCNSLHSGNISTNFDFNRSPRSGRLTIASFIYQ